MSNKKELPKNLSDALKDVPEGTVAIPYLTPTPKDNIKEEVLGGDKFKVIMDNSYMVVIITKDGKNISFSIEDSKLETDYYLAKMNGYILCEIAPRYTGDKK